MNASTPIAATNRGPRSPVSRLVAAVAVPLRTRTWAFPLLVFLGSRVLFFAAGTLAAHSIRDAIPETSTIESPGFLHEWAHWDGAWYSGIAVHGYPHFQSPLSTNFFPLYPATVGAGAKLFGGPAAWGVAVSLAAGAAALYFVYALGERLWDRRRAQAATLALAFFPTSFFLNAVYTESLFLALTAGALWALYVCRNPLLAGVLGGFASATRHVALFLVVPFALEWLRNRRELGLRGLVGTALVPTGIAGYMVYLWQQYGDPLEFKRAANDPQWRRSLANPGDTLTRAWHEAGNGLDIAAHPLRAFHGIDPVPALILAGLVAFVALVLSGALLVLGLRVLPPALWLYAAALALFPVLYASGNFALFGYQRYLLVAFPLFYVLGTVLARSRVLLAVWLTASAAIGVYLTALFTTWRWVA